jgi:hypothetical protein
MEIRISGDIEADEEGEEKEQRDGRERKRWPWHQDRTERSETTPQQGVVDEIKSFWLSWFEQSQLRWYGHGSVAHPPER